VRGKKISKNIVMKMNIEVKRGKGRSKKEMVGYY